MPEENFSSDDVIIRNLKKGDNKTLEMVYKLYWPMIHRFVLLNNGNVEDAEELFQNGVIALFEKVKVSGFQLTCSLKTFIYSICRYKWLNELRSRKSVLDIEEYNEIHVEDLPETEIDLPNNHELIKAVESLGQPCKMLLTGFYYEKLSLEELAVKLNYSSANVAKQQKFRCIERLKKIFLPSRSKV